MSTEAMYLGSNPKDNELLNALQRGTLYRFSDWPNPEIPNGRAGVYTVWDGDLFIYVGMAGRGMKIPTEHDGAAKAPPGLRGRLNSHASGRRSGDQFCLYVFDRLVLHTLSDSDRVAAAQGSLSLDRATKVFIHDRFSYRYGYTQDGASALAVEHQIRRGAFGQKPMLNPSS